MGRIFVSPIFNGFTAQIDAHAATLCNEQAAFVLTSGGLGTVYSICDKWKGDGEEKLCDVGGMDPESVASAMIQFDGYLSQPEGHHLPQFTLLSSPIVRDKIIKKVRPLFNEHFTRSKFINK